MQKHNYKVVEAKENPLESVIEKDNVSVKFTLIERESRKRELEKKIRELKAQLSIDESCAKNVAENHPEVLQATEEDIKRAHELVLYVKFTQEAQESRDYIKRIEDALEEWGKEYAEILLQTNIVPPVEVKLEDLQ